MASERKAREDAEQVREILDLVDHFREENLFELEELQGDIRNVATTIMADLSIRNPLFFILTREIQPLVSFFFCYGYYKGRTHVEVPQVIKDALSGDKK